MSLLTIASVNKYDGVLYGVGNSTNYLDEDIVKAKVKITMVNLSFFKIPYSLEYRCSTILLQQNLKMPISAGGGDALIGTFENKCTTFPSTASTLKL